MQSLITRLLEAALRWILGKNCSERFHKIHSERSVPEYRVFESKALAIDFIRGPHVDRGSLLYEFITGFCFHYSEASLSVRLTYFYNSSWISAWASSFFWISLHRLSSYNLSSPETQQCEHLVSRQQNALCEQIIIQFKKRARYTQRCYENIQNYSIFLKYFQM